MQKRYELTVIPGYKALLGEGILWNHSQRQLYWVDIEGRKLIIQSPDSTDPEIITLSQKPGCVVCTTRDTLLLGMEDGVYHFNPAAGDPGTMELVFPNTNPGKTRCNDGACDPAGRFWVGTTDLAFTHPEGTVYRLDQDLSVREIIQPVVISNGITWSPDNTRMYYIDTSTNKIAAYDYNNVDGSVRFDRYTISIPEDYGNPDGSAMDEEGMLWIALWAGHSITRWNPETGTLLEQIRVPALNVTSLAFGGDNLDTLFITTAAINTPDDPIYEQAGSLFKCKPGIRGIPHPLFHLQGGCFS
jgi:sugar lactone lactonase YvrE